MWNSLYLTVLDGHFDLMYCLLHKFLEMYQAMDKKSEANLKKEDVFLDLLWTFHNCCVDSHIDQKYIDAVVKHNFAVVMPRVGGIQVIDRAGLNFYETNNDDEEAQFTLKRGGEVCRIHSYGKSIAGFAWTGKCIHLRCLSLLLLAENTKKKEIHLVLGLLLKNGDL